MICSIYKITNKRNGKVYVGQTWQLLAARWRAHARSGCPLLHRAIQKYGPGNFSVELITVTHSQEMADYWENHFIRAFNTVAHGYNLKEGGAHGKHSARARIQRSIAMLGNKRCLGRQIPPEVRAKIGAANMGRPGPSKEHRERMSAAKSGVALSALHVLKIRAATPRGESNVKAKLSEASVLDMRARHAAGESFAALGRAFGIARANARKACLGITWAHLNSSDSSRTPSG
jgi:group I intron endonuclease